VGAQGHVQAVQVTDQSGNPVSGVSVTFAVGSGLAGLGGALGAEVLGLDPSFPLKFMIYFLIVVSVGGTTTITAAYAGTDGKFGNGVLALTTANGTTNRTILGYAPTAGANYLAAFPTNVQGGATYGYSVNVMSLTGVKFSAKEPATPDSAGSPLYTIASLAAAGPNFATDGAVDMNGDYDYIRFTAAGGTSRLHVQVVSPGATAQVIEHSNGTCAASIGGGSGQHVAAYENAATPGTQRCIQIGIFSAPKYPWPYRVIIAAR